MCLIFLFFVLICLIVVFVVVIVVDWDNWLIKVVFSDGIELVVIVNIVYDFNDFFNGSGIEDVDVVWCKEFGVILKKKGVYDVMVYYDFQVDIWLDVFVCVESKVFIGCDIGCFCVGYMKILVGLDVGIFLCVGSFLEIVLFVQVFYEGCCIGVEWVLECLQYLFQVGVYGGKDLQGDNFGIIQVVCVVWILFKVVGDVVYLGLVYLQENLCGYCDGCDVYYVVSVCLCVCLEVGLIDICLVDFGVLIIVDQICCIGLEGIWIWGLFLVQGEVLQIIVICEGKLDYIGYGQYVMVSWVFIGEFCLYSVGVVVNIKLVYNYGVVELVVCYSCLDLDDVDVFGGCQYDWMLGVNWYFISYFKFQVNYVKVDVSCCGVCIWLEIVELCVQMYF